jgi:hypothetical protein
MPEMPLLCFLPLDNLLIHEQHDDQRARPLMLRIRSSGVFRNPPIVTPLHDGTDRYMVLDGANRVTALKKMGYAHILVQVVEPDDPGLTLYNWNHVVWELEGLRFFLGIARQADLRVVFETDKNAQASLLGDCRLALLQDCRGRYFSVCTQARSLEERVDHLNAIVESYRDKSRLDRTNLRDVQNLGHIYPALAGLVIFPTFKMSDLLNLAGAGYLLPSGITRFSIAPRVLHLNYPLEALAEDKPIEEKNRALIKWLQEQVTLRRVRYYAEPTFLFDE